MKTNLYIPKKIRVGFQRRDYTSSKKLAYIVFFDEKDVLKRENSFEEWRDKSIPYIDLENNPTDGFIFNKGFEFKDILNSSATFLLVNHPNGFDFQISINNLVYILLQGNISNHSINGKCVFAWDNKNLILIPVDSIEYQQAISYTEKLSNSISSKNLKKGFKYNLKKSDKSLTYLGYFNFFKYSYFDFSSFITQKNFSTSSKKHVFYDKDGKFSTPAISTLLSCISDTMDNDYEKNLDIFFKSKHSNKLNTLFLDEPTIINDKIFKDYGKEKIYSISFHYKHKGPISFNKKTNLFEGFHFYIYELTLSGYKRKNVKTMYSSPVEINEFLSIFPEIKERGISLNDFLIMAKERGFKSVYLRTEVEDSIKYKL